MRLSGPTAAVVLLALAVAAPTAAKPAPTPLLRLAPGVMPMLKLSTARHTGFDPARHGFHFNNSFANNIVSELDLRSDGLCGGMVYAALDYYHHRGVPLPTQNYGPAQGTALRAYLYDRQMHSIDATVDRWAELAINPFGARNSEFYRWGIQGSNGGRLEELRREIDAGRPVPLGLRGCSEGCFGDHQVLAIGYDLGAYKGDFGAGVEQLRIFIYDPNFPNQKMTLVADPAREQFRYLEDADMVWRTYFVNRKYNARRPPLVAQAPKELVVTLRTGGDDLRGGNDNVHVHVLLRNGRALRFDNVNLLQRWVGNSNHSVALPLPAGVSPGDVRGIRLETTFGGGLGGDNWNLDRVTVGSHDGDGDRQLFKQEGAPLFRFTGDQKTREFIF